MYLYVPDTYNIIDVVCMHANVYTYIYIYIYIYMHRHGCTHVNL